MFITSLISQKWSWYHEELVRNNKQIRISAGLFDRIIILLRVACKQKGVDEECVEAFVNLLESKKEFIVKPESNSIILDEESK